MQKSGLEALTTKNQTFPENSSLLVHYQNIFSSDRKFKCLKISKMNVSEELKG